MAFLSECLIKSEQFLLGRIGQLETTQILSTLGTPQERVSGEGDRCPPQETLGVDFKAIDSVGVLNSLRFLTEQRVHIAELLCKIEQQ